MDEALKHCTVVLVGQETARNVFRQVSGIAVVHDYLKQHQISPPANPHVSIVFDLPWEHIGVRPLCRH